MTAELRDAVIAIARSEAISVVRAALGGSADGVADVVLGKVGEVPSAGDDHDRRPPRDPGFQVRSFPPKEDAYVAALVGAVDRLTEAVSLHGRDLDTRGADVHNSHDGSPSFDGPDVAPSDLASESSVGAAGGAASFDAPPATEGLVVPVWSFGDRLRKARVTRGMDQRELAHRLGVSAGAIGQWEKEISRPRDIVSVARAVEVICRIPAAWLMDVTS